MDVIDEIKQIYYQTSAKTIQDDFARAIDLLKTLPDEASRERVAVYMEGLAEMRNDWRGPAGGSSGGARKSEGGKKAGGANPGGGRRRP